MSEAAAGFCAQLSAPGLGGLQVVALVGRATEEFLTRHFVPASRSPGRREVQFGRLICDDEIIDEVVIRRRTRAEIPTLEICLHGGHALAERFRVLAISSGFRFERVAECAPELVFPDLWAHAPAIAREAVDWVERVDTPAAWAYLSALVQGTLTRDLEGIHVSLAEGRHADRRVRAGVAARLSTWYTRGKLGLALHKPPVVVLAGAANAGKSSIFNRLTRLDLSIVHESAGTTRDANRFNTEILGYPVHLVDTAGIRSTVDVIESMGIERTKDLIQRADLIIDVRSVENTQDELDDATPGRRVLVVNKIDLLNASDSASLRKMIPGAVFVSACDGRGLDELRSQLIRVLPFGGASSLDFGGPFTERQMVGLAAAMSALESDARGVADLIHDILAGGSAAGGERQR